MQRRKKNQEKIAEIRKKIQIVTKDKISIETEKRPFDYERDDIRKDISEKQNRIEKLGKKIFGKKKAEEEIGQIKLEIEGLENKYQEVNDKIQVYEKAISDKMAEINVLEKEIREIERENEKLRNM